jgi:hypothetical protein
VGKVTNILKGVSFMFDNLKKRVLPVVVAGLTVVALVAVPAAGAAPSKPTTSGAANQNGGAAAPSVGILYDQYDNPGANAIVSQNFEASLDSFDSYSADDFLVPSGFRWQLLGGEFDGLYFNGPGPCRNFDIEIFRDSNGFPGQLLGTITNNNYQLIGTGTFRIIFRVRPVLPAGHYWISPICNMDFTPAGEWGWTDRSVASNSGAVWQNPGGGFGICPTWDRIPVCIGVTDVDFMFRLVGNHQP